MEIYLVGGAVRDALLGIPVKERDWVVVGSNPEEMRELGFKTVGKDFPVFLHPNTKAKINIYIYSIAIYDSNYLTSIFKHRNSLHIHTLLLR